jgi:hypothetical protein
LLCFQTTHLFWLSLSLSLSYHCSSSALPVRRGFFFGLSTCLPSSIVIVCTVSLLRLRGLRLTNLTLCFFLQVQGSFFSVSCCLSLIVVQVSSLCLAFYLSFGVHNHVSWVNESDCEVVLLSMRT